MEVLILLATLFNNLPVLVLLSIPVLSKNVIKHLSL